MFANLKFSLLFICLLSICLTHWAKADSEDSIELPQSPQQWLNAPPLSKQALAGKGAVLVFFEETCPKCRQTMIGLQDFSKKYQLQPVVFIGVNSGTTRPEVQKYLAGVNCNWPTIVDYDRQLEAKTGVGQISLQNIIQVLILSPEGEFSRASFRDMDAAAEKALVGAKWKIDPSAIPADLIPIWREVEIGNYTKAAAPLKRARADHDSAVRETADKLYEFVNAELQVAVTDAEELKTSGQMWNAYKSCGAILAAYNGYDLPSELKATMKELIREEAVRKEISARQELLLLQKSIRPAYPERNASRIAKYQEKHAGTEASAELSALLEQQP